MSDGVRVIRDHIMTDNVDHAGGRRTFDTNDVAMAAGIVQVRKRMGENVGGLAVGDTVADQKIACADDTAVARDVHQHAVVGTRVLVSEGAADEGGGSDANQGAHTGTQLTF